MSERMLKAILAAVAMTAVTSAACKKTPRPAEASPSPSASSSTVEPNNWTVDEMTEVRTTRPVDAMTVYADELEHDGKRRSVSSMVEHGQLCPPQIDGGGDDACWQRVSKIRDERRKADGGPPPAAVFAIFRHGDQHETITDIAALRALLGEIDTPMEAALLASFSSGAKIWSPQCTGMTRTIVLDRALAPGGGFKLAMEKRLRKGTLTKHDSEYCTNCLIMEKTEVTVKPSGEVVFGTREEEEEVHMGCGRSPGFTSASLPRSTARTAGEYLARAAHLEAASVTAFERIAAELEALGAPVDLVMRARRAAEEERMHARVVGALARAHGAEPLPFVAHPYALRDAFALALDNAIEGCVNETFGAALLHAQALAAESAPLRTAFAAIADEEASHAVLSFDLAAWLDTLLRDTQRAQLRLAARAARTSLHARVGAVPSIDDAGERARLGLVDPLVAQAMCRDVARLVRPVRRVAIGG